MDIGSNTVRVLVGDGAGDRFKRIELKRRITRLGGLFNGNLHPESMSRTLDAVKEFSLLAGTLGAETIRIGCTGVIRKAGNKTSFLEKVKEIAGHVPVLLSGEQEATLAAIGTRKHLGDGYPEILLLDIGGFSTELTVVGETIQRLKSHDIGVVSLTENILRGDPPTAGELAELNGVIEERIRDFFRLPVPKTLVGIAGTASTVAAMDLEMESYSPEKINRHEISRDRLDGLFRRIVTLSAEERLTTCKGLEKGREDLIPAGLAIVLEVMRQGGIDRFTVSTGSLLEGILLNETWPPENGTVR